MDKASKSGGRMSEFIAYAIQGLVDQLREQLQVIRDLQWNTTWRNYVYERFGKGSVTYLRRRRLVLELSNVIKDNGWVRVSEIPNLSPHLAREYAERTGKTLARDINAIAKMNLIERSQRLVRANKRLILAFLPARAPGN